MGRRVFFFFFFLAMRRGATCAAAAAAALLCAAGGARAGAQPAMDLKQQLAEGMPDSAELAESAHPPPLPFPWGPLRGAPSSNPCTCLASPLAYVDTEHRATHPRPPSPSPPKPAHSCLGVADGKCPRSL